MTTPTPSNPFPDNTRQVRAYWLNGALASLTYAESFLDDFRNKTQNGTFGSIELIAGYSKKLEKLINTAGYAIDQYDGQLESASATASAAAGGESGGWLSSAWPETDTEMWGSEYDLHRRMRPDDVVAMRELFRTKMRQLGQRAEQLLASLASFGVVKGSIQGDGMLQKW